MTESSMTPYTPDAILRENNEVIFAAGEIDALKTIASRAICIIRGNRQFEFDENALFLE